MATYVIGDVQGCFRALQRLLDQLRFDESDDRLWFVGDLVNRGPDSLATLRFVQALGDTAVSVLGNHDLHLLAVAEGFEKLKRDDTLEEVLTASDRDELLEWLRHRPLMHVQPDLRAEVPGMAASEGGYTMVHAGLLPSWTVAQALELAAEVEAALRAASYRSFLAGMYGNRPERWSDALTGLERLRVIVNAMTRLRLCTADGAMEFEHKGRPTHPPPGYMPWFEVPGRRSADTTIVFGHWSALGLVQQPNVFGLDTGCLWGRRLSALRLDDRRVFQVPCAEEKPSKQKR
jgi:bis(5'-nucleosyl)-tetraphosphatase (symmetrical)